VTVPVSPPVVSEVTLHGKIILNRPRFTEDIQGKLVNIIQDDLFLLPGFSKGILSLQSGQSSGE
jgi:hypothetical protein